MTIIKPAKKKLAVPASVARSGSTAPPSIKSRARPAQPPFTLPTSTLPGVPAFTALRRRATELAAIRATVSPDAPKSRTLAIPPEVAGRAQVILRALVEDLHSPLAGEIMKVLEAARPHLGQTLAEAKHQLLQIILTDVHRVHSAVVLGSRDGEAMIEVLAGIVQERKAEEEYLARVKAESDPDASDELTRAAGNFGPTLAELARVTVDLEGK